MPQADEVSSQDDESERLQAAVTQALEDADRLSTWPGRQAVELAAQMEAGGNTGASVAALSKELREVMDRALDGVKREDDPLDRMRDELAARRARRGA